MVAFGIPRHTEVPQHVHIPRQGNCNNYATGYEFQNGHSVANGHAGGKVDGIPMSKISQDKPIPNDKPEDAVSLRMLEKLDIISRSFQSKEKVELVKEQWHIIAVVFDRISMWTFAAAILITMSMIFYQAPGYVA